MRKSVCLAGLLFSASLCAATSESFHPRLVTLFNPKQTITLDLHDAKLTEVITTLGALASLPVVIEPGIEEKVTLKVEEVPFVKVLDLLSKANGISLRVEDGKLVASRVRETPAAAPVLPEKFRDAPRILLTEYPSAAASPPPLLITTTWKGEETCSIARIGNGGGGLLEIPLSKTGIAGTLVVADLGYDPVLKSRTIALETADGSVKHTFSLAAYDTPLSSNYYYGSVRLLVSQSPKLVARFVEKGDCNQLLFQPARGGALVTVAIEAVAHSEGDGSSIVFAPRVQTTAGTVFKATGSETDSGPGQLRGYAVTGYVSRDGKSIALAFKARAVWTNPADGRQFYFTQAGREVGFVQLMKRAIILDSLIQPGVATPYPLDLRVLGGE